MKRPQHLPMHVIENVPIDQIRSDPRNPRDHRDRHVKALAKSIAEFGFNVPVLIDDNGQLISGHGRYAAALLLGLATIPAIRLKHLNEPQRQAFMIADNRLHDLSN
jgi:ParB/RepB/Spo0J family partition protein